MNDFYIMLGENDKKYKILKITYYAKGEGFGVIVPYINAQNGGIASKLYLYEKLREENRWYAPIQAEYQYTVSDNVKLSYHGDGNIQFSKGAGQSIISGLNEDGTFKGLGIKGFPLKTPCITGPSIVVNVWDIKNGYKEITTLKENMIVFLQDDLVLSPHKEHSEIDEKEINNEYQVEFWILPKSYRKYVNNYNLEIVPTTYNGFYNKQEMITLKVIPYIHIDNTKEFILGVRMFKTKTFGMDRKKSGYTIQSLRESVDGGYAMLNVAFPTEASPKYEKTYKTLDYKTN